jgi:hypothetical protein
MGSFGNAGSPATTTFAARQVSRRHRIKVIQGSGLQGLGERSELELVCRGARVLVGEE